MDLVLIPGFWLDASSWDEVVSPLEAAGHRVHPITLPGLEDGAERVSGVGLADQAAAVVALVDELEGPVVLVGHSGGGSVASLVADQRPERVAHVVYVDSGPLSPGGSINPSLTEVDGVVPLPDWSEFDEADLTGLDDALRQRFQQLARPEPGRVPRDEAVLSDDRRYDVPSTVISCTMPVALMEQFIAGGHPYVAEFARMRRRNVIELPTGHWPQFSRPADLAEAILEAVDHRP